MRPRNLQWVMRAVDGKLYLGEGSQEVRGVCTNSQEVKEGDLFIPLVGERFDGHEFIGEAMERGAVGCLCQMDRLAKGSPAGKGSRKWAVIGVASTRKALGAMAGAYRQECPVPTLAVGGSNGKTTTKDWLAAVMGRRMRVLKSPASFNNDIGVPLTLLQLDETRHDIGILEVGSNHPGELAVLLDWIRPKETVLTSIGREHLEFFNDLQGVAWEEGYLAECLPPSGWFYCHGDAPYLDTILPRSRGTLMTIGEAPRNLWQLSEYRTTDSGARFRVDAPTAAYSGEYEIGLWGRHQVVNAGLVIAVAAKWGVSRSDIQAGLLEFLGSAMRMQVNRVAGVCLLNDAYNANADSMRAALRTLREIPDLTRRVAVLGDMAELGIHADAAHREVGAFAAQQGVDFLFAIGGKASEVAQGARSAGLYNVREFGSEEVGTDSLIRFVRPGDGVLVKGSRSARMERVWEALKRSLEQGQPILPSDSMGEGLLRGTSVPS